MGTWRRGVVLPVSISMVLLGSGSAFAASSSAQKQQQQQINNQISQLREQISEVSGDEAELLGKLDDINNRKAALEGQISDLQAQVDVAQHQLDDANGRLLAAQQQLDAARQQLDQTQAALKAANDELRDQAVNAYMGQQSDTSLADFVLRANDMREVTAASEYLHQVVADRQTIVEERRELEGRAKDLQQQMAAARDGAQQARDVIAKQQQQIAQQKAGLDSLHQQLQAQADEQNRLLAEAESKKADYQAKIDDLQQESDSIAAMLRGVDGGTGTPPVASKGILMMPTPGARPTSPFGMRLDPVTGKYQLHAGQDFGVPVGTPVHAAADGVVVSAGVVRGYGNYTCVNHGNGLATCYAHQSQINVSVGQHVSRGQVIGLSGNTGYSTGPHLHFEVRINGNPVNPMGYL